MAKDAPQKIADDGELNTSYRGTIRYRYAQSESQPQIGLNVCLKTHQCPADALSQVAAFIGRYCSEDPATERLHNAVQVCWAY